MNKIISIALITIVISGFAFAETIKVWPIEEKGIIFKKFGHDIKTVAPPYDFIIKLEEISKMCSPRKYAIVIYADKIYYYVAKYGAPSKEAKIYGIRINGKTGEIVYPMKRNKYSIMGSLKEYSIIR